VALPIFGHQARMAIETVCETYGGDGDGDTLHDAWETDPFGDLARDGDDDGDGDHSANSEEFHAGTDPNDPDGRLLIFCTRTWEARI